MCKEHYPEFNGNYTKCYKSLSDIDSTPSPAPLSCLKSTEIPLDEGLRVFLHWIHSSPHIQFISPYTSYHHHEWTGWTDDSSQLIEHMTHCSSPIAMLHNEVYAHSWIKWITKPYYANILAPKQLYMIRWVHIPTNRYTAKIKNSSWVTHADVRSNNNQKEKSIITKHSYFLMKVAAPIFFNTMLLYVHFFIIPNNNTKKKFTPGF